MNATDLDVNGVLAAVRAQPISAVDSDSVRAVLGRLGSLDGRRLRIQRRRRLAWYIPAVLLVAGAGWGLGRSSGADSGSPEGIRPMGATHDGVPLEVRAFALRGDRLVALHEEPGFRVRRGEDVRLVIATEDVRLRFVSLAVEQDGRRTALPAPGRPSGAASLNPDGQRQSVIPISAILSSLSQVGEVRLEVTAIPVDMPFEAIGYLDPRYVARASLVLVIE